MRQVWQGDGLASVLFAGGRCSAIEATTRERTAEAREG
jgi:hypothetical protein